MPLTRSIRIGMALLFLTAAIAAARPLQLARAEDAARPEIAVLSSNAHGLSLEFRLPALGVDEVTVGGRTFQALSIPGGGESGAVGSPGIPTYTRLVSIPARSGVAVSATILEEDELPGYQVGPVPPEDGGPVVLDAAAYGRNDLGDAAPALAGAPAILRDMRVVPLRFQPVRYNPTSGVLKVARRIRVDVAFRGEDLTNAMRARRQPIPPSFDTLYRQLVVNYPGTGEERGVAPGTWVVICANDAGVTSRLQPLLDWRKRKGYPVRLATTAETGTTKEAIKAWLQNAYNTWPVRPEYVAIAGDADGSYSIPTWFETLSGYGGCGDHPYAQLDGTDVLADVNIGRLSFSSYAELETIVAKIIGYESTPYTGADPNWFTRACLVGDPTQSGISVVQLQQWAKVRLLDLNYTQVDTIFSGDFLGQMMTDLNRGDTVFSYRGWYGMSGFSNSNAYQLTNGWKMPFCVAITCGTGTFAGGTSVTEALLRAGTATSPKGGVGAIGTATTGTHTRYNNCIHYGVLYGLLYEGLYTMGADLTRGKLEMYLNYEQTDPDHVLIWSYWNNLMGDPAAECWTGYPNPLRVSYPSTIPVGTNSVIVTALENDQTTPVRDAQVCLWKGTETYVVGTTDSQGTVELPVNAATAGNMLLTVTKHNHAPLLSTIAIASGSAFVGYQASTIDDDASGQSQGNGDRTLNPGETIELGIQLKNFGGQAATGVTATLTCADPYVTLLSGQGTYGDIPAGGSAWSAAPYVFSIDRGCPHGRAIRFGIDVRSGTSLWHSLVDLPVVSAQLDAGGYHIYNAGANGILDPGETVQLSVKLQNDGGATAANVVGTLTSLSPYITVTDGSGAFGTIAPNAQGENLTDRFTISASPDTYQGFLATFRLVTEFSGGTRDTTTVGVPVGQRTSVDPVGPDRHGYYAFDDTDGNYPERPVYSWVELDPSYGGTGTQIPLNDFGQYQDASKVIDLPFPFVYYGASYAKATVCSNGWVAMGPTYLTEYRNWTLPSAGGPQSLIAAFWDDLNLSGGGKVLSKYDAANNRFILEWSRVLNDPGSQQTFEAILYDPAHYPTSTGDGPIVFQYNTVNNTDSADNYATVGIENADHTDGLLYTFSNLYPPGAATLAAGRAIRIVPASNTPSGTLQGTVRNASNGGGPLPDAHVLVLENGRSYITGPDGTYGGRIAAGTYTVVGSHDGFAPDTTRGVVVHESETTQLDFSLVDVQGPTISNVTNDGTTDDAVGPYPIQATIDDPSGVASAGLFYRLNGAGWIELPMSPAGDVFTASIPGRPAGTKIDYYVWAQDGGGRTSVSPADAPASFYTLYVTELFYAYDCEDAHYDSRWQLGAQGDQATTGIWIRDDPVASYSDAGVCVQPDTDRTPAPGVKCFVTGNANPGDPGGTNDVDGGCTTLLSPIWDLSGKQMAFVTYWRWWAEAGASADDTWQVDASSDGGVTWVPFERCPNNDNVWRKITLPLHGAIQLTGQVQLRFVACDLGQAGIIEALVDDVTIETFTPNASGVDDGAIPARTELEQSLPNPFGTTTTIRFLMSAPALARIEVYDAAGRRVRTLVDATMAAGVHTVVWDGRDDRGRALGSGTYFYRMRAGATEQTRRLTVLR